MIVTETPSPAFDAFVAANASAWQRILKGRAPGSGFIAVDLLHNNASVLILNILVARYLAELWSADIVGLLSPSFTGFTIPMGEVERLARSFGIGHFAALDGTAPARPPWRDPAGWRLRRRVGRQAGRLAALSGTALRQAVLGLNADGGLPIGDFVYDSHLYARGIATFESYDDRLAEEIRRAERIAADAERLFRERDIRALVVSHTVYVDYGVAMRVALNHAVPVFAKAALDPIRLRRYRRPEDAAKFVAFLEPEMVGAVQALHGAAFLAEAERFYPPRPTAAERPDFFRYGYGAHKRELGREELLSGLGLDSSRPTCAIMAHRFIDAVHFSPGALYQDYYQWLDAVLDLTTRIDGVNWLLKQHPYEVLMGENEYFQRLLAEYQPKSPALRVVPDAVATSSLFTCVEAITTMNGTAGIEFAAAGVPCILAGYPFYAEFDFVRRPSSREAYLAALAGFAKLERLSPQQVAAAKAAALVEFKYTWHSSSAVPRIGDLAGRAIGEAEMAAYWRETGERMSRHIVADDPLFRNLQRMLHEDRDLLLNYELQPETHPGA